MTDEEKKVEEKIVQNRNECSCQVFSKFLMLTSAVFLGSLLAILVAKALMAPAYPPCPCAMKQFHNRPGFERQLPSGHMGKHKMHNKDFQGKYKDFDKKNFNYEPIERKD